MKGATATDWATFTERFLTACREASRAKLTLRSYAADLAAFSAWYAASTGQPPAPEAVTALDLTDYRAWLQRGRKPATVNRKLAVLKSAFAWATSAGVVVRSPAAQVRPVAEERAGPRALDHRALGALLREAQRAGGVRDVALVTLLVQTGLRVSEALALTWGDMTIRERGGQVVVRHGKGDKRREVPLNLTARRALTAWRQECWPGQPDRDAPVFPGRSGGVLSARAVQVAFVRYARRAGLPGHVTPHTLRHTFCKSLVDAGESLDRVAALAGHSSLNTTARYTKPTAADLEAAVGKLEWT